MCPSQHQPIRTHLSQMVAFLVVRCLQVDQIEEAEANGHRRRIQRVPRVIPDCSNPLEEKPRWQVKEHYRFYPETLIWICHLVDDKLKRRTNRSSALPVLLQVCAAIRFFTCGSYYQVVGSAEKLSRSSVYRAIHAVAKAICQLTPRFIRLPRGATEIHQLMDEFEKRGRTTHWPGIPGVTGAIDGTLIHIQRPKDNTFDYICRKNFPAINCQAIAGPDYCFQQTSVRWPGGVGDSRMFTASGVSASYDSGKFHCSELVTFYLAQVRAGWFQRTAHNLLLPNTQRTIILKN